MATDPESRPIMSQSDKDRHTSTSVNMTESYAPQHDIETGHAATLSETHAAAGGGGGGYDAEADADVLHSRSNPPLDRSKSSLLYDGPYVSPQQHHSPHHTTPHHTTPHHTTPGPDLN